MLLLLEPTCQSSQGSAAPLWGFMPLVWCLSCLFPSSAISDLSGISAHLVPLLSPHAAASEARLPASPVHRSTSCTSSWVHLSSGPGDALWESRVHGVPQWHPHSQAGSPCGPRDSSQAVFPVFRVGAACSRQHPAPSWHKRLPGGLLLWPLTKLPPTPGIN